MTACGVAAERDALDLVAVFRADFRQFRNRRVDLLQDFGDRIFFLNRFVLIVIEHVLNIGG